MHQSRTNETLKKHPLRSPIPVKLQAYNPPSKKWLIVIWKVDFESAIDVTINETNIGMTVYVFARFDQQV